MNSGLNSRPMSTISMTGSKEFIRFLRAKEGCEAITSIEDNMNVEIRVDEDNIIVNHDENCSATAVNNALLKAWHEISMRSAMRLSLLSQLCSHSQTINVSIRQAALISFYSHLIVRDCGISEIIVDPSGVAIWFGSVDAVKHARMMIERMFQQHLGNDDINFVEKDTNRNFSLGLGSPTTDQPDYSSIWNDHPSFHHRYLATMTEHSVLDRSSAMNSNSDLTIDHNPIRNNLNDTIRIGGTGRKRERVLFMVRSTDAPRLIGTRGVNKKRIEENTGCSITLHTESKKDGEFPVEIIGTNARHCEIAKQHIETFLANSGSGSDEEKKFRERPKVHLVFSPKKAPRKEKEETTP